jgi:hypothetical protein
MTCTDTGTRVDFLGARPGPNASWDPMCGSLAAVARDVVDQLTCGERGHVEPRPAAAESAL